MQWDRVNGIKRLGQNTEIFRNWNPHQLMTEYRRAKMREEGELMDSSQVPLTKIENERDISWG